MQPLRGHLLPARYLRPVAARDAAFRYRRREYFVEPAEGDGADAGRSCRRRRRADPVGRAGAPGRGSGGRVCALHQAGRVGRAGRLGRPAWPSRQRHRAAGTRRRVTTAMALATKCPHCNTIFRVAHDQLKLRGGIVRCGACNEVFDGNAALVEPAAAKAPMAPLPSSSTHAMSAELAVFDAAMAALDTRAADTLQSDEAASMYTLDVDTAEPADGGHPPHETDAPSAPQAGQASAFFDEADIAAYHTQPALGGIGTAASTPSLEDALDLDLDVELDPDVATARDASGTGAALEAEATHAAAELPLIAPPAMSATTIKDDATSALDRADDAAASPDHAADAGRYPGDDDFDAELAGKSDAEIAAELVALSQADTLSEPSFDAILELAAELTIEAPAETEAQDYAQDGRREPTLGEPPSEHLVAAALDDGHHDDLDATREDDAAAAAEADAYDTDAEAESGADQVDDDVQVSAVGLARASTAAADPVAVADADTIDSDDDSEEPGFVKRARRRQKMGKAARIVMAAGSVALLAALLAQGIGTFRNQLAAELPQLKPLLVSACAALGCKVELPTQIDDLSIEPGELQTLAENTYSFTTQLRNGGAITQAWPYIELVLNDNADKPVLRRVFAPRDYLAAPADAAQGFAPRSELSVKLYFEIAQLKASGYHIAVFYP